VVGLRRVSPAIFSNSSAPSIDSEFCAVNETSIVCSQKDDGLSDFIWRGRTTCGRLGGDRKAPCKSAEGGDWKTIDDYLPTLKYGTQLPPPTQMREVPPKPPPIFSSQRVSVVDFDIPFWSVLGIMFKWMAAGFVVFCCFLPIIVVLWIFVMTILAGLISGAMSSLHHP
jgi:hypothetical protein